MSLAIGLLVGAVVLVLVLRQWLLRRECPQCQVEPFDGVVYRVGKAAIAERRSDAPRATVIAMHGFVADMRYFTEFYADADIQLIVLTSCDYHLPITGPRFQEATWARLPTSPEGTIPYDAEVLVQALEHLPKTRKVRVHGHSRGGAVVLEAASRRPDLFADVEVVLEAPVLPRALPYRSLSAVALWLLAFLVPLWRRAPIAKHNLRAWGPLDNARKRQLIESFPSNPKRVATMAANLRGIEAWIQERDGSLFGNVQRGTVLVPGKDRVLDSRTMLESARQAEPRLSVVRIEGCSHFVLFDRPDTFPPLQREREERVSAPA